MTIKRLVLLGPLWFIIHLTFLSAQQIQLLSPPELSVCEEAILEFEITTGNTELLNGGLTLALPCGFSYLPGSLTAGAEASVDDSSQPVFALPDLGVQSTLLLGLSVQIDCEATACIDNGSLFTIGMELTHQAGTQNFSSEPFNVETPYLIITGIDEPYWEGSLLQTYNRKITIRNTRLGALSAFEFLDTYDGDISISSLMGETLTSAANSLLLRLGPADFMQIGDGDGLFEFNEEIVITEHIEVVECALEDRTVLSDISVRWGCESGYCQSDQVVAQVKVVPIEDEGSTDVLHSFEGFTSEPTCYEGGRAEQRLRFRRDGQAASLTDFELTIEQRGNGRGILLGSITHPLLDEVVYHNAEVNSCGDSVSYSATLYLNAPLPNSITEISWESAYCTPNECNPLGTVWAYHYNYRKACAVPSTQPIQGSGIAGSSQPIIIGALSAIGALPPSENNPLEIVFSINGYELDAVSGSLQVNLTIPKILVLQLNNNFLLGGQFPVSQNITTLGGDQSINLVYDLPLSNDDNQLSLFTIGSCNTLNELPCKDTIISDCADLCSTGIDTVQSFPVLASARVIQDEDCPLSGQLLACADYAIPFPCFDGFCRDTIHAYFDQQLTLERSSLGWPDKDGDRQPDTDGLYDFDLMQLHRMAPGDTFNLMLEGILVSDQPGLTFDQLVVQLSAINTELTRSGGEAIPISEIIGYMLGAGQGIQHVASQAAIYDASADTWYELGEVLGLQDDEFSNYYHLSMPGIRDLNATIPFDFRYAAGDSIRLQVSNRVTTNFSVDINNGNIIYPNAQTAYPQHATRFAFDYNSRIYLDTVLFEDRERFLACNCQTAPIEISNLSLVTWQGGGGGTFSANCMETLPYSSWHRVTSNLAFDFPGEIRPFHRPGRLRMRKYEGIVVDSLEVRFFEPPANSLYLQPEEDANFYYFDFPESTPYVAYHNSANDRFFELRVHRHFEACVPEWPEDPFNGRQALDIELDRTTMGEVYMPASITVRPSWVGPRYEANDVLDISLQAPSFTYLSADFELGIDLMTAMAGSIDLTYENLYLRPVYTADNFEDITLFNAETGEVYPQVNGYFQLGDIVLPDTLSLRLRGRAMSCEAETIYLDYGFDCSTVSNPASMPCALERDSVQLSFPPGLIDLQPNEEDITGRLCNTMPQTEALLFNAELGSVYEVEATITLPLGLNLVPGSCLIEYPAGSGQTVPITDPEPQGNRTYTWALADLWLLMAEQGLPGVNEDPANAFYLRFTTQTDCDFISGTRILHRMVAEEVCGVPTNNVAKVSGPYQIEGIDAPYNTNLSVEASGSVSCGDTLFLTATFEAPTDNPTNLYVSLPEGFAYLPGSTSGSGNFPEPVLSEGQLQWAIMPGFAEATLSFQLLPEDGLDCSVPILSSFTTASVSSFCESEGVSCDIEVVTGETNLPLTVEKGAYEIVAAELTAQAASGLQIEATVLNTANPTGLPLEVGIYLDMDANGALSSSDSLLTLVNLNGISTLGGSVLLQTVLQDLPRALWCRLMLVLEAVPNCACNTIAERLPTPTVAPTAVDLCWADSVSLGVSTLPGFTYQWNDGTQLSCTQCAETSFTANNTGAVANMYSYVLSETNGACAISHPFEVTVYPQPGVLTADEAICQGDTLSLVASLGETHLWSGPALLSNGTQSVQAAPNEDASYTATVTNAVGCTSTDTVAVTVLPPPTLNGAALQRFCLGLPVELDIAAQPGFTYEWLNGQGRLSDLFNPNPTVLLQENFVYELRVSNGVCSRVFEVAVEFEPSLDITGLNDTLIACLGDTLTVVLDGGLSYEWQGNNPFFCMTPNCSSVQVPVGFSESSFTIQATDEDGCMASQNLLIQSVTDSVGTLDQVNICQGDSLNIAGQWVTEAGLYCDTTTIAGNCISVRCTEVTSLPTWSTNDSAVICEGEQYDFFGQALTQSGVYTLQLSAENGCDSLIVLELEVTPNVRDQQQAVICEGDTLLFEGQALSVAGTYTASYPAANGCDSIITMDLSVRPAYDQNMQVTICEGETYAFNGEELSEAGIYLSEGQTQFGCDSLVSLQLTVEPPKETFLDTVLCADERMVVGGQIFDAAGDYTIPLTSVEDCDSIVYLMLDYFPAPAYEAMTMPDFGLGDGMITLSLMDSSWVVEWPDGGNGLQRGNLTAGEYPIAITDEWGCRTTVFINVEGMDMIVDMPNTFTPNGDGTNDYFYPVTNAKRLEVRYFVIFNRWGQKVYDNEYPDRGWDGVFNGKPQPSEVYYYLVEVRVAGGVWRDQGDVTLVR